jgi:hypothetical protein
MFGKKIFDEDTANAYGIMDMNEGNENNDMCVHFLHP